MDLSPVASRGLVDDSEYHPGEPGSSGAWLISNGISHSWLGGLGTLEARQHWLRDMYTSDGWRIEPCSFENLWHGQHLHPRIRDAKLDSDFLAFKTSAMDRNHFGSSARVPLKIVPERTVKLAWQA